jgi:uncharacterized oxidoreductase
MHAIELNIEDPASIASAAREVVAKYPMLNVLINNAGIMRVDDVSGAIDDAVAISTVTTNLLGPIRMTSALVEHLKKQKASAIINVSSVLGFVPLAKMLRTQAGPAEAAFLKEFNDVFQTR